jgi:hypothetical protein
MATAAAAAAEAAVSAIVITYTKKQRQRQRRRRRQQQHQQNQGGSGSSGGSIIAVVVVKVIVFTITTTITITAIISSTTTATTTPQSLPPSTCTVCTNKDRSAPGGERVIDKLRAYDHNTNQPPRRRVSANPSLYTFGAKTVTEHMRSRSAEMNAQTLPFATTMMNHIRYHLH